MSNPTIEVEISSIKETRRDIDNIIQRLRPWPPNREKSLTLTKLQEAVMWLGMDLKRIADQNPGVLANPYPGSKDPEVKTIEPTADGLKL